MVTWLNWLRSTLFGSSLWTGASPAPWSLDSLPHAWRTRSLERMRAGHIGCQFGHPGPPASLSSVVGTMRTMTLTDMLSYGGVIIQVIATMSCLAADSKTPVADPSSKVITTNLHQQTGLVLLESKRVMVSVETAQRTCASPQ